MPDNRSGKFVILDGAGGTMLQQRGLKPGQRPDIMNITAPEAVAEVQRKYLESGSEIIYTNTFGANAHALKKTGYTPGEVISAAVEITRRVCKGKAKTALDIGPLGDFIEPLGEISFSAAYEMFKEQAVSGAEAGADLAVIETMSDLMELKAAICAVRENTHLPVFATMTFRENGRTFAGCQAESFAVTAQGLGAEAIGLNCSLNPSQMVSAAKRIAKMTALPLIIKPNAGLPDGETGLYNTSAGEFAREMAQYAQIGARYIGGCCGTTPEYIRELRRVFSGLTPVIPKPEERTYICSATRLAAVDGEYKVSRADAFESLDAELDGVSTQAEDGGEIVEIVIPNNAQISAQLVSQSREITDKPVVLISGGDENALKSALREISGIAAVVFINGKTEQLIKTAKLYGAVIVSAY